MKLAHRLLSVAVMATFSLSAAAATITYTSQAAFEANLAAGAYTEGFDGMGNPPAGAVVFSGGGFSYSASAPSDIYLAGGFLGVSDIDEPLTLLFTSGNVRAVAGEFFATDINDDPISTLVTLTLNDGTTTSFTPTSFADSYRGFISDIAITSLVISAPGQSLYAGLDNLTVGGVKASTAVPEPAGWMLVGLALAGLAAARRRAD